MIAPDRDRRLEIAPLYEIVDRLAPLSPFTITEPANAGRQSLEVNTVTSQSQPAIQRAIVRKHLEGEIVSLANVVGIARQRHPAKWSLAFTEERSNVLWHKTRDLEGVPATCIKRLLANVVAVIESDRARTFQRQHRFYMPRHRLHRPLNISIRIS